MTNRAFWIPSLIVCGIQPSPAFSLTVNASSPPHSRQAGLIAFFSADSISGLSNFIATKTFLLVMLSFRILRSRCFLRLGSMRSNERFVPVKSVLSSMVLLINRVSPFTIT